MSAVVFAGTGSSTGASVIAPCVNRIVPITIDCANNPGILFDFGITVGVAEVFTAGVASPVFFVSILGAGGIFLWNMYHLAMRHCQGARGADSTSVLSGGGNRGGACAYGSHCSICAHRGNAGVAAFPGHILIGGIGRLYGNGQGIAAFFL